MLRTALQNTNRWAYHETARLLRMDTRACGLIFLPGITCVTVSNAREPSSSYAKAIAMCGTGLPMWATIRCPTTCGASAAPALPPPVAAGRSPRR